MVGFEGDVEDEAGDWAVHFKNSRCGQIFRYLRRSRVDRFRLDPVSRFLVGRLGVVVVTRMIRFVRYNVIAGVLGRVELW